MNVFTTDHPMASQPSMLDAKAYPRLSYFCRSFILALILTPVLVGFALYSDMNYLNEFGAQVDIIPPSWLEFALVIGETFVLCFLVALVLLGLYRLIRGAARSMRSNHPLPLTGREFPEKFAR